MDQYLNSDMAENYLDFLGEVTDLISAVALYITIALAVGTHHLRHCDTQPRRAVPCRCAQAYGGHDQWLRPWA